MNNSQTLNQANAGNYSVYNSALNAIGVKNVPQVEEDKVRLFQTKMGLTVDGDAGPETKRAVVEVLGISAHAPEHKRYAAINAIKAEISVRNERAQQQNPDTVGLDNKPHDDGFNLFKPSTWFKTAEVKTKDAVSSATGHYVGTEIPKGTFNNPTPLEFSIMQLEGFTPKYSRDSKHSTSECIGYGYYKPVKGSINREKAFTLMQEQIGEKIDHAKEAFGPNFDKLPKNKQESLLMFAYNIDVANPNKVVSMKHAIQSGNLEQAGDLFSHYCHASSGRHHNGGLVRRREFEGDLFKGHIEKAYDNLAAWKELKPAEVRECVAYYKDSKSSSRVAETAYGNSSHDYAHKPSAPAVYASNETAAKGRTNL